MDMNDKLKNRVWQCLPREARDEIKERYKTLSTSFLTERYMELNNLFGKHNLTSDTEPEEMLHCSRDFVIEKYKTLIKNRDGHHRINSPELENWYAGRITELKELFGDKCLPDKEEYTQVEPKFKVGDKVKICINSYGKVYDGIIKTIKSVRLNNDNVFVYSFFDYDLELDEHHLEPYTEPETKDNMEEKELNLCELLKGCEGEDFYSNAYGEVTFEDLIYHSIHGTLIHISWSEYEKHDSETNLFPNGKDVPKGMCILWPSRVLYEKYPLDPYSAWMEWKEASKKT